MPLIREARGVTRRPQPQSTNIFERIFTILSPSDVNARLDTSLDSASSYPRMIANQVNQSNNSILARLSNLFSSSSNSARNTRRRLEGLQRPERLARPFERSTSRGSITPTNYSKSKSNSKSNSQNNKCLLCLQDIKPNSKNIFTCTAEYNGKPCNAKIHKKCVKTYCESNNNIITYKRRKCFKCPICNWNYFCNKDFEKATPLINSEIKRQREMYRL